MLFTSYSLFRLSLAASIFLFVISLTSACTQKPESKKEELSQKAFQEQVKPEIEVYRKEREQRMQKYTASVKNMQAKAGLSDKDIVDNVAKTWRSDVSLLLKDLKETLEKKGLTEQQIEEVIGWTRLEETVMCTDTIYACTSLSKDQVVEKLIAAA